MLKHHESMDVYKKSLSLLNIRTDREMGVQKIYKKKQYIVTLVTKWMIYKELQWGTFQLRALDKAVHTVWKKVLQCFFIWAGVINKASILHIGYITLLNSAQMAVSPMCYEVFIYIVMKVFNSNAYHHHLYHHVP